MHSKNTSYRPDIDGLRAVAVILVLLFHFDLGVSGGFVGVDVFFVISGFLITEVIRNAVAANRFSFIDFYSRRLLRLHPALLFTVGTCLGAGFLLMDPASFSTLARSAQYSIFSASNFYFWLNQGYFDASAQTQPLLHTWSLAAEWQFYAVWPFIVWAALKVSDKFLGGLLLVMTIASLAGSQIMLSYDSSAAYFMMPFRVFELSIGALLVFVMHHRSKARIESAIVAMGLAMIILSAFTLDATHPFPGLRALIPCLGAAACIYAGRSTFGSVLRIQPMVWIGLISYSVYLVHWPIAVFYKYYIFREIELTEKLLLLAASIIAGIFIYRVIERLFMKKWALMKPVGLSIITASIAALTISSSSIINDDGLKSRIPNEYLMFVKDPASFHKNNYGGYGFKLETDLGSETGKTIAVFGGDSFAQQYASGLDKILKQQDLRVKSVFLHGCILSSEYTRLINSAPRPACYKAYSKILDHFKGNKLPFIYAQSWNGYFNAIANSKGDKVNTDTLDDYYSLLEDILSRTRLEIGDRPFIIVGSQPYPSTPKSPAACLLRPAYVEQKCESMLRYTKESSATNSINSVLKMFAESHRNTYYVDATDAFCIEGMCEMVRSGKILYSDSFHLSIDGSIIASKYLMDGIDRAVLENSKL